MGVFIVFAFAIDTVSNSCQHIISGPFETFFLISVSQKCNFFYSLSDCQRKIVSSKSPKNQVNEHALNSLENKKIKIILLIIFAVWVHWTVVTYFMIRACRIIILFFHVYYGICAAGQKYSAFL